MEPYETLKYMTPDEVAECVSGIEGALYSKLWNVLDTIDSQDAVPSGGDGSNGTVETPPNPVDYPSGTVAGNWNKFTPEEQKKLNELIVEYDKLSNWSFV